MALYFASQGTGEMVWPIAANLSRITMAACGSLLALDVLGWGVGGLFGFVPPASCLFRRACLLDHAAGLARRLKRQASAISTAWKVEYRTAPRHRWW